MNYGDFGLMEKLRCWIFITIANIIHPRIKLKLPHSTDQLEFFDVFTSIELCLITNQEV